LGTGYVFLAFSTVNGHCGSTLLRLIIAARGLLKYYASLLVVKILNLSTSSYNIRLKNRHGKINGSTGGKVVIISEVQLLLKADLFWQEY
jgi:hypothetical protein